MRGASALQSALDAAPGADARAFVVWLPVILTDRGPPSAEVAARVRDPRAVKFWDRDLLTSAALLPQERKVDPGAEVVWDIVLWYPPGARWETAAPPPFDWRGRTVVSAQQELTQRLQSLAAPTR